MWSLKASRCVLVPVKCVRVCPQDVQREGFPGDAALSGRLPAAPPAGGRPHPGVSRPARGLQVSRTTHRSYQ